MSRESSPSCAVGESGLSDDAPAPSGFQDIGITVWGDTPLDDLLAFVNWLDKCVRGSATTTRRFTSRLLHLHFQGLREGDGRLPVLLEHGNVLLGNLLSLLSASDLMLRVGADYEFVCAAADAARLLARSTGQFPGR